MVFLIEFIDNTIKTIDEIDPSKRITALDVNDPVIPKTLVLFSDPPKLSAACAAGVDELDVEKETGFPVG